MPAIFLKSATSVQELPESELPQVAFVGRSNVGKSSLLNHLTGQKGLARESATPGRTQHMNVFEVNKRYHLVDLPGYGFAHGSKTHREGLSQIIRDYMENAPNLRLVFVIIDGRHGPTTLDRGMITFLQAERVPFALIVNKMDKVSTAEAHGRERAMRTDFPTVPIILHSNVTGLGRGEMLALIEDTVKTHKV